MRVILLKDVAKIGRRFDIVEVPDGYAMNKLVPQGMAAPASAENVKRVRAQKDKVASGAVQDANHFDAVVKALEGVTAELVVSANSEGGLFESLKPAKIAEGLTKAAGMPVLPEYVSVDEPIKHTGEHQIKLALGAKHAEVILNVSAA